MDRHFDSKELQVEMMIQNVTKTDLASKCDTSYQTIYRLLKGYAPTHTLMCKITTALNLSKERATQIFFADSLRNA